MNDIIKQSEIQDKIHTIRGMQVMLDSDLAEMYYVELKRLNEQVKRNIKRFPEEFRFQLTNNEFDSLRSQIATLKKGRGQHQKYLPYVFTEQGVSMLSAVLNSDIAIEVSIKIINSFVEMRKFISTNAGIFQRLDKVEQKLIQSDENFNKLFNALADKSIKPNQDIFFNGQIFDAYKNNCKLLIVNYQLTKWFAFSKMDISSVKVLDKVKVIINA